MPHIADIASGVIGRRCALIPVALVRSAMKSSSTRPCCITACMMALSIATSVSGLNLQYMVGMVRDLRTAGIHDDQGLAGAFTAFLRKGGGHRVVLGGVGADDHDHLGLMTSATGLETAPEPIICKQGRHRRGMAEPGAVIDVVAAKAGADQLLEQVGLFVGALG